MWSFVFAQNNVFEVHQCRTICQHFISFCCQIILHCMDMSHIFLFIQCRTFSMLILLAYKCHCENSWMSVFVAMSSFYLYTHLIQGEDPWRRILLRVPWTARRSNQSILKEINPEYSSEGLMLKLKLPILWPPDVKSWLIRENPDDAGKDWRQEEKGVTEDEMVGWHHWLNGRVWASSRSRWRTGKPGKL